MEGVLKRRRNIQLSHAVELAHSRGHERRFLLDQEVGGATRPADRTARRVTEQLSFCLNDLPASPPGGKNLTLTYVTPAYHGKSAPCDVTEGAGIALSVSPGGVQHHYETTGSFFFGADENKSSAIV